MPQIVGAWGGIELCAAAESNDVIAGSVTDSQMEQDLLSWSLACLLQMRGERRSTLSTDQSLEAAAIKV